MNQVQNQVVLLSIMIGLGETKEEIIETMDDLRANNVDIVTIGQYLTTVEKTLES